MATDVIATYQVLDKRDRDVLNNSINELNIKLYDKESALKSTISDLDSRHETLKSYAENNKSLIDNLTTDKISHSEIVNTINSELSVSDDAANVPLSAQQGGVLYNRTNTAFTLINKADDRITSEVATLNTAINTEKTRATNAETGLDNRLKTVEGDVNTFLANADLTENAIDTLREIQTYIDSDVESAAQMTANITANKNAIDAEVTRAKDIESNLTSAVEARVLKASIVDNLTTSESAKVLSANQGVVLKGICDDLNTAVQARVLKASIVDNLTTSESVKVLSANQGVVLKGLCDDISEEVSGAKDEITSLNQALQKRIPSAAIVDNLTTAESAKVLSANQGVVLKGLFDSIPSWSMADTKPSYTYTEVGADAAGTAASVVSTHNTSTDCHSDIRQSITNATQALQTKVPKVAIVDNLTTDSAEKVLSANQGVVLKGLYDGINQDVSDAKESITTLNSAVQARIPSAAIVDSVEDNLGDGGKFKVLSANQGVVLNKLITNLTNTVNELVTRVAALEGGSNSTDETDKNTDKETETTE